MEKNRTPDGEGGLITSWTEGATIRAALRFDSTMEARRAEHDGVTSVYTLLAPRDCGLVYHDVLKRVSDGLTFRITSNSGDSFTPKSSTLALTAVSVERWNLT